MNWYAANARRRRVAAPARLGGRALVAGDRRRALAPRASAPALFDETSFAKIEVAGPRAAELLERLCDNRVARDVGRITYTQMLNRRGGIECDFTVTRLDEERFLIVTGTAFGSHDLRLDRAATPARASMRARRHLALGLLRALGPARARRPRAAHADDLVASRTCRCARSPWATCPVRALRVTYVGELGWELYCPMEYGAALWRTLWEAGEPHGLVAGGYRAIDSLRLEKGYRVWGADITPDDTPYEAGLGFCVKARQGVRRPRRAGRRRSPRGACCCLVLEDPRSVALGNEPVRVGGEIARPRHHRRLRLHGRALDRLRVPARRAGRAGYGGGGRGVRRLGGRRGGDGAAARSRGRTGARRECHAAAG